MKLPALLFLFLSSVVGSSAWAGIEAAQGRSTSSSQSTGNVIAFQTSPDTGPFGGELIQIVAPRDGLAVISSESTGTAYDLAPEPDYLQMVQPAAPASSDMSAAESGIPDSTESRTRVVSSHSPSNEEINAAESGNPYSVDYQQGITSPSPKSEDSWRTLEIETPEFR